jgi:hypothetical protein
MNSSTPSTTGEGKRGEEETWFAAGGNAETRLARRYMG